MLPISSGIYLEDQEGVEGQVLMLSLSSLALDRTGAYTCIHTFSSDAIAFFGNNVCVSGR